MKAVFLALIAGLVVAVSSEAPSSSPVYDYHRRYGIPRASQIKTLEEQTSNERIVGGSVADVNDIPYQIGLVIQILFIFNSVCGGSILSSSCMLTAAHCNSDGVMTAQSFTVVAGSNTLFSGGQRIVTNVVTMHPEWNPSTARNDVAVLFLRTPLTLNNVVKPIALSRGSQYSEDFVGQIALASGFGLTSDSGSIGNNQVLSSVRLPIIANRDCFAVFGQWVHDSNICTSGEGGRSTCGGDSGGPLVVEEDGKPVLLGLTSFGAQAGCQVGFPAAYARVTWFYDWISSFLE